MAELEYYAGMPTLEDQFRLASKRLSETDGEVLVKYWHMTRRGDMEFSQTSHHLYGDSFFPKYMCTNIMAHDFACIRKEHQEEDLWQIFEKHGIRALAPLYSLDAFNPTKSLKRTPTEKLQFHFIGAMDRSNSGAEVVPITSLLDAQILDKVEKRAITQVLKSRKSLFSRTPGL